MQEVNKMIKLNMHVRYKITLVFSTLSTTRLSGVLRAEHSNPE